MKLSIDEIFNRRLIYITSSRSESKLEYKRQSYKKYKRFGV